MNNNYKTVLIAQLEFSRNLLYLLWIGSSGYLKKKYWLSSTTALIALIISSLVYAESDSENEDEVTPVRADSVELDTMIVTGTSPDGTAETLPNSVLVISEEEIERSGATTLVDVLKGEANLNVQSFTETGKNSTIDIRGMGATAVSNVLLMVDGERLNNSDLSGADYSSVPLEIIERIEVIRGGGSVRYGDGAVGGVINVITKEPDKVGLHGQLHTRFGNFQSRDHRSFFSYAKGPFSMTATLSDYHSDGFRDNGGLEREAATGKINYKLSDGIKIFGRFSTVDDEAGLPGVVTLDRYRGSTSGRQSATFPDDFSETDEQRYSVGLDVDTEKYGDLVIEAAYRDRDNPFLLGFNDTLPEEDQEGGIEAETISATARYELPFKFAEYQHQFFAGFEWQDVDYMRAENGTDLVGISFRRVGDVQRRGAYIETVFNGPYFISLTSGYRLERFKSSQDDQTLGEECDIVDIPTVIPGPPPIVILVPTPVNCVVTGFETTDSNSNTWHNRAFSLGLTWEPLDWLTFFASINRNFRSPNIDELLLATPNLGPQKGFSKDVGVRVRALNNLDISLSIFSLKIEDEIVFAEDFNRNLDSKTKRVGLELDFKYQPTASVQLSGAFGYVRPRLEDQDADIPLVPRVTASLGADLAITERASINLRANYVDERIDGNDFGTSRFDKLDPYTVVDLNGSYTFASLELFGGIQNLTNEVYSPIGYSNTFNPMPDRNGFVGLRFDF